MFRRIIASLALVAVIVQTLPVKACAIEFAVTGTSCHGEHVTASCDAGSTTCLDGHADAPARDQHDPECLCEMPRGELDRQARTAIANDLAAAIATPASVQFIVVDSFALPVTKPPPPDTADAAVSLPRLN